MLLLLIILRFHAKLESSPQLPPQVIFLWVAWTSFLSPPPASPATPLIWVFFRFPQNAREIRLSLMFNQSFKVPFKSTIIPLVRNHVYVEAGYRLDSHSSIHVSAGGGCCPLDGQTDSQSDGQIKGNRVTWADLVERHVRDAWLIVERFLWTIEKFPIMPVQSVALLWPVIRCGFSLHHWTVSVSLPAWSTLSPFGYVEKFWHTHSGMLLLITWLWDVPHQLDEKDWL